MEGLVFAGFLAGVVGTLIHVVRVLSRPLGSGSVEARDDAIRESELVATSGAAAS